MTRRLLLLIMAMALAACSLQTEPIPAGPIRTGPSGQEELTLPAQPPNIANGQIVYEARCASCHGPEGMGNGEIAEQIAEQGGNLPNFADSDIVRNRTPEYWYQITTNGNIGNLMPPWREALTDQERWNVTYYLYTFARPEGALSEGEALFEGETDTFTDLEQMTSLSLADIRDEYVPEDDLTEDERWAVAWYLQSLPAEVPAEADTPPAAETEGPVEEPAESTGDGVVSGSLINGSGTGIPDDLTIQIRGLQQTEAGVEEFLIREETVNPDGTYSFDSLPFERGSAGYVISTVYEGVEFTNGVLLQEDTPDEIDLPLTIYENTTDPAALVINTYSFAIEVGPGGLQIFEVIQVRNRTQQVYVTEEPVIGGRRGTFRFRLPPDAVGVQFQGGAVGGRYVEGEGASVYDTAYIPPNGEPVTLTLSYTLPYEGMRDVAIFTDYEVQQAVILAPEDLPVRGERFTDEGLQQVGERFLNQYRAGSFEAGETIIFRVGGGLGASLTLSTIVGVALVIVVIAAVAYGLVYGPNSQPGPVPAIADMDTDAATLVAQIKALDAAYEEGVMDRFSYEEQRAELKAKLATVLD